MKIEHRFLAELRADGQGDEMAIAGYAALFNSDSKNLGGFKERIAPGAFTRSIEAGADVKALVNHDPSQLLGRTKNGTLSLSQDERGLKFRCVLNAESGAHRDLYAAIKRGDMDECSFAFTVPEGGQDWQDVDDPEEQDMYAIRTLKDVNLMDVSAVTYPAYNNTSVGARAFPDGIPAEVRSVIEARQAVRAKVTPPVEKRDDDSLEDQIREVSAALAAKFPSTYEDGSTVPEGYNYGQYWVVETYSDYLIVCGYGPESNYFKITYHEDEANETYLFGDPEPVEQVYVPSERAKAFVAEKRASWGAHLEARKAEAEKAQRDAQAAAEKVQSDADQLAAQVLADAQMIAKAYKTLAEIE
jgi:HK97 family phage prohead protease